MRFKYLADDLSSIEETYTDKEGKTYRISRAAKKMLELLRQFKIDKEKEVRVVYNPSSNVIDITISGFVFDSVLEDMKEIVEATDAMSVDADIESKLRFEFRIVNIYKGMYQYPNKLKM